MLITKREAKSASKKLLSVLLAIIMLMSSMSVCFGTIAFAGSASASAAQWNTLMDALRAVAYPVSVTGAANNYVVNDPDGTVIAAVNAYWSVFTTIANTNPASATAAETGKSDKTVTASNEGNLTVNQANNTIRNYLSSNMSDYTTQMGNFLSALTSGVSVIEKGAAQVQGPDETNNTTVKTSDLADTTVKFSVKSESLITSHTLVDLPDDVAITKEYYVYHKGDRFDYAYDYTAEKKDGCGNVTAKATYKHTYTYFSRISSWEIKDAATVNTAVIKAAASTLSTYADYFSMDIGALAAKGNTTLGTVKTAVNNAKSNVVSAFSEGIFKHFFSDYNIDALNKSIDSAVTVNNYIGIARDIIALAGTDYSAYSYDELNNLYSSLDTKINNYKPNNAAAEAYIVAETGLDLAAAKAELVAIDKEIKLIEIREAKAVADAHIAEYNAYTVEQITDGTLSAEAVGAAIVAIAADIEKLQSFNRAYVDEVCGSDYFSKLNACAAHLDEFTTIIEYNEKFAAKYAEFAADIYANTDVTLSDDALLAGLQQYDSWYTGLKALVNEMKSVLGEDIANALFKELDSLMSEHLDAGYAALKVKVETQVEDAYALFTDYVATYGELVDFKSVSAYSAMQYSIGLINVDAYNFLPVAQNGLSFSKDTIDKYNALQKKFPDFDAFVESMGFSEFKTTEIEDIIRPDTLDDIARKNENGEYVVDDEKIEKVITQLEALLQNEEIKALLGSLLIKDEDGNPTGESLDIGAMLKGLIKDALFTDSFINTVVGMLYPLVTTEFIKVWANELPETFHLDTIVILDLGFLGKIQVPGQDPKISFDKNLYTVLKESPLYIFPDLLATQLDSGKYAENIRLLNLASSQFKSEFSTTSNDYYTLKLDPDGGVKADKVTAREIADKTPWDSAVLKDEAGSWLLDWGVDATKEKLENGEITDAQFEEFFYQAFDDAVEGLKPLLLALIANKSWTNDDVTDVASLLIKDISLLGDTNVTVDLDLSATENRGYANLLVPVYEVLGLKPSEFTAPATLESYATNANAAADILRAILTPVFTFISKLGANPLDTLLGILPDICYVLATQSVPKLLDMLKTTIKYFGKPIGTDLPFIGELDLSTISDQAKVEGGADISVGSMLDLKDLGIDLTDGINSVLDGFGLDLPQIDQGKIATLGEMTTIDTQRADWIYTKPAEGKAYHVEANKADVLVYLLDYALGSGLLESFIEAPEGILGDILTNLSTDPDAVIAAVVELLNQEKYDTLRNYEWFNGVIDDVSVIGNSATGIYLNPNNDWTEEKAEYLYNNIDALVTSILKMAKLDLNKETPEVDGSLGEVIGDAVGGLLSDKTLTSLAALLAKLDLNALVAGDAEEGEAAAPAVDVNALVKALLGIDLSVFAAKYADIAAAVEADENYVHSFGVDAGTTTFADALAEMLAPLSGVLDFILKGENLVISLSETEKVSLIGYDGYNNALVPLLEALGCEAPASADVTDVLSTVVDALVAKIDTLTKGDVIKNIIDLLPGVLYFIASKGLSVSVRNLLQPVYVILDTIRPIIDVDLNELINGLLPEDFDIMLNIDDIGVDFIFDLLGALVPELDLSGLKNVIYDVCIVTSAEYESVSTLAGQKIWKKGAYNEAFDQADMLTVVLSFILEWATIEDNAAKLDELLKTDGIIASLGKVFADVEITYGTPNWMYWFDSEEAFNAYIASGEGLPVTLDALDWEKIEGNNEWDLATAKYFAENIDVLVDTVIAMLNKDKEDAPKTLKELIDGLVNGLVDAGTLNDLVAMITDLLADIDENLINAAGYLLDVDIAGLKAYECKAEINSISDFINELANVIDTYAGGLVNWLFFGDDYRFAKKSDKTDTIVINGGLGYEKGLAMILEALGCELPEKPDTKSVLGALAARVEAILANPVDEVLGLLPNLVYFLNANGAGVAVDNLLKPVNVLLDKLSAFGLNVSLADLIKIKKADGTELALDLAKLSLANVVEIVEGATDLSLDAAEEILVGFCTGKITEGTYIYRMDASKEDVITILFVVALELLSDDAFTAKLDEMLGTDFIAVIKTVFASAPVIYVSPEWEYPLADNGTVDAMKYSITYPNNWTEATAEYVTANLPEIADLVAGLIDSNYTSISALLKDKVNVFTSENLQAIVDLVANLLKDIDDGLLEAAGVLLGADIAGLKAYKAPDDIITADAFAAELANVLNTYAKGVVEWLLLGKDYKFFVKDIDENGLPVEYITINGAHGYAEGLALLLEALGCDNLPAITESTEDIVKGVLDSLAALINKLLDKPVETVIEILPNVLYFLNANGVAAVVDNTIAAVTALLAKLEAFGLHVDINELVNLKSLMGIEDTAAAISFDNLSMAAILEAVSLMTGLDITLVEDVLVGFALGQVNEYDSVSISPAYRMTYKAEFEKRDMVTVLVNLVVLTLTDEANAEFVKDLVGEDVYTVIENICVKGVVPVEPQDFDWKFTDKADTGYVFSALGSSELYEGYSFGPLYTKEMAEYIADNFGTFVNNIIYLLGVEINGVSVDNLTDLINGLLNGSLYNSSNVIAIRDALAGVLDGVAELEVNGKNVGKYIAAVLANSEIADISAVAKVEVPEFTEDREQFVKSLCDVLEPLYPVLKWVLADEDIAFFVDLGKKDLIRLEGAEGYAFGILPILETLECEDILAPADYYAAVEADGSVLLTSILNPLLNRVDEIVAEDPASEILAMLPNLIYFINSNGVDTVVKNTLNAVYALLSAIEPIAKIDLYELIGIDLSTLDFEKLFQMLLDAIADATGYRFENLTADAVTELTVGTLQSYTSLNGRGAYRMVYNSELSKAEMVTVVLRLLVTFITHENNVDMLVGLLKDNLGMDEDAENYIRGVLDSIVSLATDTYLGMDQALAVIYYLFYGANIGSGELVNGLKDINAEWQKILKELGRSDNPDEVTIGNFLADFLDKYLDDVFTSDGLAPNGIIAFFQRIIEWFNKIIEWFKNLFK